MTTFEKIKEEELCFDDNNPRLVEFNYKKTKDSKELINILWEAMDVNEIVMSIIASGYFEHDPLIVTKEKNKYIVIEGNRRLAAVRLLRHPNVYIKITKNIPKISKKLNKDLGMLPVIIQSRENAWKFLGFKHVNGPAKWGSYAKAKYISEVHKKYTIPLEKIGEQIGDTHQTVQRLYRGLMVIEQAEKAKIFSREDVVKKSFPFSHMYVGLQREGIKAFLNISEANEEKENPVSKKKLKELGELCLWMYGSKGDDIEPVVQSQNPNLKELDLVLQNRESLACLRSDNSLHAALELTKPSSRVFEDELLSAKRSIIKARGLLSEGYDGSAELLKIAGSIAEIADDLYVEMERKRTPRKKKRLTEN